MRAIEMQKCKTKGKLIPFKYTYYKNSYIFYLLYKNNITRKI